MNLNELAKDVHENAKAKGFYENPPNFGERLMLITSELAEALEEYRDGRAPTDVRYVGPRDAGPGKPEGIPSEIADVIIRCLDLCACYGIDIEAAVLEKHAYNKTRPHKHGRAKL